MKIHSQLASSTIAAAIATIAIVASALPRSWIGKTAAVIAKPSGAGILAPLGFAITAAVFPIQERGKALATIAIVAIAAAIVELASWEWIFIVNVPLGVLGIVLARRVWPETYDLDADPRIDYLGMSLLALAVFCLTFGLVDANHRGWDDGLTLFLLQSSILLGIAFVLSQR